MSKTNDQLKIIEDDEESNDSTGDESSVFPLEDAFFNSSSTSGDQEKTVVPRKGADKFVPSKPRKGVGLYPATKSKPTISGVLPLETEDGQSNDFTALIVGLCLGLVLVLIVASLLYFRMKDVWTRRQYKRVDFLIEGMYT